jgi:hypothetical protein
MMAHVFGSFNAPKKTTGPAAARCNQARKCTPKSDYSSAMNGYL